MINRNDQTTTGFNIRRRVENNPSLKFSGPNGSFVCYRLTKIVAYMNSVDKLTIIDMTICYTMERNDGTLIEEVHRNHIQTTWISHYDMLIRETLGQISILDIFILCMRTSWSFINTNKIFWVINLKNKNITFKNLVFLHMWCKTFEFFVQDHWSTYL